jgi:hypothetical protein
MYGNTNTQHSTNRVLFSQFSIQEFWFLKKWRDKNYYDLFCLKKGRIISSDERLNKSARHFQ